ncbi:hypothetical protein, partial [Streptomyces sp. NPDC006552]|uniref:hypothetical protein n=1 Tax=Streptomyces sp. NPDC006552 TaxID=3157179 RepID=UPI0033B6D531
IVMLANRHDWLSAFSNELGVVLAVERMLAERDGEGVPVALGMFLANTRRRADELTVRRRDDLNQLGMRW